MHFTCRSFLGATNSFFWSQFWENEPDDPELVARLGHLFGLIILESVTENENLFTLGHQLISSISKNYFDSQCSIPETIQKIINDTISGHTDFKIHIVLASVKGNQINVGLSGQASVYILREHQISPILQSKDSLALITGSLKDDDRILFFSQKFINTLGWHQIKNILSDTSISSLEENFLSLIYSQDDQQALSASLIVAHLSNTTNYEPLVTAPTTTVVKKIPTVRQSKKSRLSLIIASVLLILLFTCFTLGFQKNRAKQKQTQFTKIENELIQKINNINTVRDINFDAAQKETQEAQKLLNSLSAQKIYPQKIADYQKQLQSLLVTTGSQKDFTPEVFYDTSLISSTASYSKIFYSNKNIYLLDKVQGRLDQVDLEQSKNTLLIDENLKNTLSLSVSQDQIFLLTSTKILKLSQKKLEDFFDFSTKSILPQAFASWNGTFYILDSTNKNIQKISSNTITDWLKDTTLSASASSIAINGKIWVLYKDGTLTPYFSGKKDVYSPSQKITATNAQNLTLSDNSENMAFSDDKTVYVIDKTGKTKAKYSLGSSVVDLSLNPDNNLLYVLSSDKKIYQISL